MQLGDIFCYTLLMVTMTTTCAYPEGQVSNVLSKKLEKRMSRRESTVLVDSVPVEKSFPRPKVIYRRISKKKQAPLRATYGPPKVNYGPLRSLKKPGKKHRGKATPKHQKARGQKPPRYGVPSHRQTKKPVHGPPKINHHRPQHSAEALGFAEPPTSYNAHKTKNRYADFQLNNYNDFKVNPDHDFGTKHKHEHDFSSPASSLNEYPNKHYDSDYIKHSLVEYQNPKQSYGEPPVDSYGTPVKTNLIDLAYPTAQHYPGISNLEQELNSYGSMNQAWENFKDLKPDNNYAYSKKVHALVKPDREVYITPASEADDEQNLNSYSDIYNSRQIKEKKKKKVNYYESVKMLNQPWKGSKIKEEETDQEMIVGGQYAEPPARYVPKFQPSAPIPNDESESFAPIGFPDPFEIPSATISSYVNYKNSNMAFSPQNLNDAFSIVDK